MKADELAAIVGVGLLVMLALRRVVAELAPAEELDQAARESRAYELMREVIAKARA